MNEYFKQSQQFLDIQKRLDELSELRKQFNPPASTKRIAFSVYRLNNPEFNKVYKEQEKLRKRRRFLNPEYYDRKNRNQREYQRRVKDKLFEILGGKKCSKCPVTDERCLQFDHKNGGGLKEHERFGGHSDHMRAYYVRHPDEAREKLQVMCANCNWIKKHEMNENSYQY